MKDIEACPSCAHGSLHRIGACPDIEGRRVEPYDLLRCPNCTLVVASPVLSDDELAPYYGESFYGSLGVFGETLMKGFLVARARRLTALKPPPAAVLDVGCGDGRFLHAMAQRGYACTGMESAAAGRAAALARVDRVVANLADVGDASQDIITMWQVLEHVGKPASLFAELRRILRPDGLLLVSVPNFESVESQVFGEKWFHLDVPRHVLHFSPRSLAALLRAEGFEPGEIDTLAVEYNVFGLVQSLLNTVPGDRNALYRFSKRGQPIKSFAPLTRHALRASLLGLPTLAMLGVVGSLAEDLVGRGATLTTVARREQA